MAGAAAVMTAGSAAANALTFDVEDWHQLVGSRLTGRPQACSSHCVGQTQEILATLAEADVRATFFVLANVAETYPGLVREIQAAGHEVGSHGWSHRRVYTQQRAEFAEETRRSKALLEDILGTPVAGYRAAEFSVTAASRWALDVLAGLGFRYDSSIFPIRGSRYGIADAPLGPHRIETGEGPLVEVPMTAVEWGGRRGPIGGGGYFRLMPYAMTRAAIRSVNAAGRPAVIYFHPYEFSRAPLRLDLSAWHQYVTGARYSVLHNVNRGANRRRFARLLREFRFQTISTILEHGPANQEVF
jgi:polysaccharide deacetylase family protein (PEP-CTERM system associated)